MSGFIIRDSQNNIIGYLRREDDDTMILEATAGNVLMMRIPTTTIASRPAAVSGTVGLIWHTREGAGTKTYTWQCVQNDANTYEWIQTGIST